MASDPLIRKEGSNSSGSKKGFLAKGTKNKSTETNKQKIYSVH